MEGGVVKVIAPFLKTKHKALFLYRGCFLRSKRGFSVLLELQRSWWRSSLLSRETASVLSS